jgi:hypothetical protein
VPFRLRYRLGARPFAAGLALTALFVVSGMVLTPIAQAGSTHASVTYLPKFPGKATTAKSLQYFGCGIKAKISKAPKFNLSSGVETLAEKTTAKGCASPLSYNDVDTTGDAGMWTKPFTGWSGVHSVVAHWTVRWSSSIQAHLGAHQANGRASASTYVLAVLYLVDESNGTYLYPSNGWNSYRWTGNGTLTSTPSATVSMYLNQSLISSHTYAIATWIYATSAAYAASTGGNTAFASIALSNSAGATELTSIVRS